MFGESNIGDVGHEGHSKAASMPDSAEVCGCNGVTKGTICKAIKDKGLFTLDEVRKHTKASASCGSCTGLVEQLLMFTAGGDYSATPKLKAMCSCTDHGHQAVRDAIRTPLPDGRKLITIASVFNFLEWKTPNGCASCRPAVNYYLISTSTSAATPTSRRTAPTVSFPACGGERRRPTSCAALPTRWTSTRFPPSRSPAASASTCWA
jgi:nitrite reductase (NADH) large subunit